jgi:hypothetical protein
MAGVFRDKRFNNNLRVLSPLIPPNLDKRPVGTTCTLAVQVEFAEDSVATPRLFLGRSVNYYEVGVRMEWRNDVIPKMSSISRNEGLGMYLISPILVIVPGWGRLG